MMRSDSSLSINRRLTNEMNKNELKVELEQYVGLPKCIDCGWKLGTDITNHCPCNGEHAQHHKYIKAITRAKFLQDILEPW